MRHFLSYDEDGNLNGVMSYTNAKTGHRGWPEEYELDNPASTNEKTRQWLDSRKSSPAGFVRYECACPPTDKTCVCAGQYRLTHYMDADGNCCEKPSHAVLINGATYEPGTIISHPPGADLIVSITADVLDGEKAKVIQPAHLQMLAQTEPVLELTYSAGKLPDFVIKAPAQGFIGTVAVFGKCCPRVDIKIRGWA